jgi:hypothetical protein
MLELKLENKMKVVNLFTASLMLAALTSSSFAYAGNAETTWGNTDKFYDVESTNTNSKNYIKSLKKSFDSEFNSLATRLPEGYVFQVHVNNLDLAGKVDIVALSQGKKYRNVTSMYYPMINLDYKVMNQSGNVVLEQDDVTIKDANIMLNTTKVGSSKSNYYYEFAMIQNWFRADVLTKVK